MGVVFIDDNVIFIDDETRWKVNRTKGGCIVVPIIKCHGYFYIMSMRNTRILHCRGIKIKDENCVSYHDDDPTTSLISILCNDLDSFVMP